MSTSAARKGNDYYNLQLICLFREGCREKPGGNEKKAKAKHSA